jgi:hypothetical protein
MPASGLGERGEFIVFHIAQEVGPRAEYVGKEPVLASRAVERCAVAGRSSSSPRSKDRIAMNNSSGGAEHRT